MAAEPATIPSLTNPTDSTRECPYNVYARLRNETPVHLAPLQGRIAFDVLLSRLDDIGVDETGDDERLIGDPRFRPIRRLPLRFTAASG